MKKQQSCNSDISSRDVARYFPISTQSLQLGSTEGRAGFLNGASGSQLKTTFTQKFHCLAFPPDFLGALWLNICIWSVSLRWRSFILDSKSLKRLLFQSIEKLINHMFWSVHLDQYFHCWKLRPRQTDFHLLSRKATKKMNGMRRQPKSMKPFQMKFVHWSVQFALMSGREIRTLTSFMFNSKSAGWKNIMKYTNIIWEGSFSAVSKPILQTTIYFEA